MKKIEVNLATHPFVNRRRFFAVTGALGVVLLAAGVFLLGEFLRSYLNERGIAQQIATVRQEIDRLETEESRLQEKFRQPEVVDILDRSDFLNSLIYQRGVSWTRIFMDLEQLMPERVQILSLKPVVRGGERGKPRAPGPLEMDLQLQVSGESVAALLEMVRRMEKSESFREPVFSLEDPPAPTAAQGTENLYKLTMSVRYAQR